MALASFNSKKAFFASSFFLFFSGEICYAPQHISY
jgi:hypothetical protein